MNLRGPSKIRGLRVLAILLLFGAALWPAAEKGLAQEKEEKRFFFVGLNAAGSSFKGDLDGRLILWHFDKAFFMPALADESLLGLGFGQQWPVGAWEVVYTQASRIAPLSGEKSGSVRLSLLEVRGKTLLIKRSPVHPSFFLGFVIPWMGVEDGSRLGGRVESASYVGLGLVLGGGVQVNLGPRLFLNAGVSQRYLWLLYAWGGGKGRDVSKLINGQSGGQMGRPLKASGFGWEAGLGVKLF